MSDRSHAPSNRVSDATTRILKNGNQRRPRDMTHCGQKSRKLRLRELPMSCQLPGMSPVFLQTGHRPQRLDCLAEDAVHCEPVSAPKFPANREFNREFCRFRPSSRFSCLINPPIQPIPYATEQGTSKHVSGKIFRGTGKLFGRALTDCCPCRKLTL
jgi:hypothetical protein